MKKAMLFMLNLLLAVCIGFSMVGCGSDARDANTILLWAGGQWTGSDAENLRSFMNWYNENNTLGLTIELEIVTDFEMTFAGAINIGEGPDLMIWDRFNTPSYAYDEVLLPIDDLIARDGIDKNKFNATAYNEMGYQGVQYGLPLDLDVWGIYVNMDIVEAYNEAHPESKITCFWDADGKDKYDWNWDEMLDVATRLKGFTYTSNGVNIEVKSGYDGKNVNEFFYHNYVSTGQKFLNDQGKTSVNNAYGDAELDYLWKLYHNTYTEGYINDAAFVQGQLAMYTQPTYFISYLNTYASKLQNVRLMPQPKYPGEGGVNCGVLGGYGCAIPRPIDESDRDEAWQIKVGRCWDFMKDFMYNETNMLKWAEISRTLPALKSTHTHEEVTGNKVISGVVDYVDLYTIRPSVPGWKDVQVNVFNNYVAAFAKGNNNSKEERARVLQTIETQTDNLLKVYAN